MSEVINIRSAPSGWASDSRFVYIGRRGKGFDGYFGNPYALQPGEPRGATIERFRQYALQRIESDPEYRDRVARLHGKTLVCFCKPAACHGDVLSELAASLTLKGGEQ